jgi:hypothetical protein
MTHDLLVAGTVSTEGFAALVKNYTPPPGTTTLVLMESHPDHVIEPKERQDLLRFVLFDPNTDFTPYTSGRIFNDYGEIRWEKHHSNIHIVYMGNKEYKPDLQKAGAQDGKEETLIGCKLVSRKYFLFGKRLDAAGLDHIGPVAQEGDFAEVRIPRLLRYPRLDSLGNAERVQLAVYEYVDLKTGTNVAYRFYNLVPFAPSEKSQEKNVS